MQMASLKHIAYTHKSNILLKENMVPLQTLAYKYNLKNLGYMRQRIKKRTLATIHLREQQRQSHFQY
jgi:hypothetical protein